MCERKSTGIDFIFALLCSSVALVVGVIMGHEVTMMRVGKDMTATETYYQGQLNHCNELITGARNE